MSDRAADASAWATGDRRAVRPGPLERTLARAHANLTPADAGASAAPLPPGVVPVPAAAAVRAADAWALAEREIPGRRLMRTAGLALADLAQALSPVGRVVVVCGAGNNGGDGYVAARALRERGREVAVVTTVPPERLRGDAADARDALPGPPAVPWADGALDGAALAVDCVLGTGAEGAPRGVAAEAVGALERAAADGLAVLACDVPSGVDADAGTVAGPAVRATATLALHAATPGLLVHPGRRRAGELHVADLGIPPGAPAGTGAACGLITADVVDALATRASAATKFTAGFVVVVAGSPSMTGAAVLCARGAQRAGAGYVQVAVPASGEAALVARLPPEVTTLALESDGDAAAEAIGARARDRTAALVVGPGLGRADAVAARVRRLAAGERPLVLDADALAAVATDPGVVRDREAPTVLTPHEGELARLLGREVAAVRDGRRAAAEEAAEAFGAVVVLKGDDTLVAHPDGRLLVSPGGVPALATAGTGDVLAGMVGALLARGTEPLLAAGAAVRLHLAAGSLAAAEHGEGATAGDVAERVGRARRALVS